MTEDKPLSPVIEGQLYLVRVRMEKISTGERIKHRLLVVGAGKEDVDRRMRWHFDAAQMKSFSITQVKKIDKSVTVLSTEVHQEQALVDPTIQRPDGSVVVSTSHGATIAEHLKKFAVGISTTILATDADHAIRSTGRAVMNYGVDNSTGPKLSEDSTVMVEEVSEPSHFAKARDVSAEVNKAHFVRG